MKKLLLLFVASATFIACDKADLGVGDNDTQNLDNSIDGSAWQDLLTLVDSKDKDTSASRSGAIYTEGLVTLGSPTDDGDHRLNYKFRMLDMSIDLVTTSGQTWSGSGFDSWDITFLSNTKAISTITFTGSNAKGQGLLETVTIDIENYVQPSATYVYTEEDNTPDEVWVGGVDDDGQAIDDILFERLDNSVRITSAGTNQATWAFQSQDAAGVIDELGTFHYDGTSWSSVGAANTIPIEPEDSYFEVSVSDQTDIINDEFYFIIARTGNQSHIFVFGDPAAGRAALCDGTTDSFQSNVRLIEEGVNDIVLSTGVWINGSSQLFSIDAQETDASILFPGRDGFMIGVDGVLGAIGEDFILPVNRRGASVTTVEVTYSKSYCEAVFTVQLTIGVNLRTSDPLGVLACDSVTDTFSQEVIVKQNRNGTRIGDRLTHSYTNPSGWNHRGTQRIIVAAGLSGAEITIPNRDGYVISLYGQGGHSRIATTEVGEDGFWTVTQDYEGPTEYFLLFTVPGCDEPNVHHNRFIVDFVNNPANHNN